jgi:hypothetical protein
MIKQLLKTKNNKQSLNNNSLILYERSNVMFKSLFYSLVALLFIAGVAVSQDLVIDTNATFAGSGTYVIKGNIDNTNTNSAKTITGKVRLNGAAQNIGVTGKSDINFDSLVAEGTGAKTLNVNSTIGQDFVVDTNYSVNGNVLNIDGTSTKTGGVFDASAASSTVNYRGTSAQTAIAGTYVNINFSNAGAKSLEGAINATTVNHADGDISVTQDFTITGASTFATIADVTATKTLDLGTTGSITTLTDNNGTVKNGSGLVTISTVTNNNGTIDATDGTGDLTISTLTDNNGTITGGAGQLTFTNGATNNGTIAGGSGLVSFNSTLNNASDSITAGSGSIVFAGDVTNDGKLKSLGNLLDFNGDLTNNASGSLILAASGRANIFQALNNSGTLNFDSLSEVHYDGGSQAIAQANYGNLVLEGSAGKTAADDFTVKHNLTLTNDLAMAASKTLTLTSLSSSNVTGAGEVTGAVNRTHSFTADVLYPFNRAEVGIALKATETGNMTITMTPGTDPSTLASQKYASRNYAFSSTSGDTLAKVQLYYLDSELQNSPTESKLGVRTYNGTSWSKVVGPVPPYVRTVTDGSPTNNILITGVARPLSGVTELGIFNTSLITVADNADFNTNTTWDETRVPDNTDDVEVNNTGITVGAASFAGTLQINAGKSLLVDNNDLTVTSTLDNFGTITVSNTRTLTAQTMTNNNQLTVNAGGAVTITGNLINRGTVSNDGTVQIGN